VHRFASSVIRAAPLRTRQSLLSCRSMLKDAVDLNNIHRALVIKLRHHGDVLLTSPLFQVLKNHAPHIELDALVYEDTKEMLTLHPAITELHTVDRRWKRTGAAHQLRQESALFKRLAARRYDLIFHLTESARGAWLARALRPRYSVARAYPDRGALWRRCFSHLYPAPRALPRHTVELHLDALRRIGVQPALDERGLILEPGQPARARVEQLLSEQGLEDKPFVHVHPTSRWLFKCWPADHVARLIRLLREDGYPVVLTAAPDAKELAMIGEIRGQLTEPIVDFSGLLSLKELAALTDEAELFVGVDSAPMHIAAAMRTPVVALFGPSGDKEWGPWRVAHRVVASDHPCRPCGNDGCGGSKVSECLTTLPVARVHAAVRELLAE
jgi:heptosyltransferase III